MHLENDSKITTISDSDKPPTTTPSALDNDVIKYINNIKMDANSIEDSIEQLETFKHKETDKTILTRIISVLAELKKFTAEVKITKTEGQKTKLLEEFKKKYKKLSERDFSKQIDLTAPKKDRKPDIGTTIWKSAKDVTYSNTSYSTPKPSQIASFKSAFRKKKLGIPEELQSKIRENIEGNYTKLAIHKFEPDRLRNKIYSPEGFSGLSIY